MHIHGTLIAIKRFRTEGAVVVVDAAGGIPASCCLNAASTTVTHSARWSWKFGDLTWKCRSLLTPWTYIMHTNMD